MLKKLTIRNFALLRDIELNLDSGFTTVTGETGSGKSLLVKAISFLIGGKSSIGVVRDSAGFASVEGSFEVNGKLLPTIRRELYSDGKTKAYIDDRPVALKKLIQVSKSLVDITSQRAFSHLLNPQNHLNLLDKFSGLEPEVSELTILFRKHVELEREISRIARLKDEYQQRQELIDFKLDEIEKVDPQPDEDQSIKSELRRLEHFEEVHESGNQIEEILINASNSVDEQLAEVSTHLSKLCEIDKELTELSDDLESSRSVLKEIGTRVAHYCREAEFDEDRLESLRLRQQQLAGLAKKFGGSIESVLEQRIAFAKQREEGDNSTKLLRELNVRREKLLKELSAVASEISTKRKKSAIMLEKKVMGSLSQLGMKGAMFEVRVDKLEDNHGLYDEGDIKYRLDFTGIDSVKFYLSANIGIKPKPLDQVASGGELSRLLLALKEALPSSGDDVFVVFDEIDTGVSGRVAELIGKKLTTLSQKNQLMTITHLPQIAGLADNHVKVDKRLNSDGSEAVVVTLSNEQRLDEIASLLSGGKVTEAAIQQARNMLAIN